MDTLRTRSASLLTLALSLFVLWTAAFGAQSSLVQRSLFLALVILVALLKFPLFKDSRLRPLGMLIDTVLGIAAAGSCLWVTVNADRIMNSLPTAGPLEIALTAVLVITVLDLSRRAIGLIFPTIVLIGLAYAAFGQYIPGSLGHRGFDIYFMTEVLLLGDIGIWGTLLGVASTIIAVFVLFGAFLLHSGGGAAFMDMAVRVSGRSVGGAAKIATVASGLFGMVSGSAVGNVATTGAFTIPLMKRLGYPAALAGAVEAVASTGGQLAPPIMGAAAFIMAEIIGSNYLTIAAAAVLPAFLFYFGVFATVHITAQQEHLGHVPEDQIPRWSAILTIDRLAPIVLSLGGLTLGILRGNSLPTAAFYGIIGAIVGMLVSGLAVQIRGGKKASRDTPAASPLAKAMITQIRAALDEGATGLIIVGILLAGAQILVAMINMTGVGVTLSSMIVGDGSASLLWIGLIVAIVCMILGMGIPTTAAYVLVAATLAPALMEAGVSAITAHMFVFYYATLSVITPPVCVGVFVAAGLAGEKWGLVAKRAVMLGAVTYVIPFLFLLYPSMLTPGLETGYFEAALSGMVFVAAFAYLFGGARVTPWRAVDTLCWLSVAILATIPTWVGLVAATAGLAILIRLRRAPPQAMVTAEAT
ncbi:TRAP transporter permease [Castellaniella sp.]|uniref:TRAP transporter permease n=1 Tax=Castellaniella sp. TaxID=1955812 RepID=UPI003C781D4C